VLAARDLLALARMRELAICFVLVACGPGKLHGDDTVDAAGNSDVNCPAVHFTAMPTTPSIEVLIDQSLSMDSAFGATTRYAAMREALVAPGAGVIDLLQSKAYFGATLYTSALTCPALQTVPRMMNNDPPIAAMIDANGPGLYTPTGDAITAVTADFAAHPPPAGSPPIIVLATDGVPNTCQNPFDETNGQIIAVAAAQAAFAAGIHMIVLSVGPDTSNINLQAMADAGAGMPNAPFYQANDPAQLAAAFAQIIGGVVSCDLAITGQVDPGSASGGTVTLDGTTLTYGTDWIVVNSTTIELVGAACTTFKSTPSPTVDASFPCGAIIE
jgi:hypothetical protein